LDPRKKQNRSQRGYPKPKLPVRNDFDFQPTLREKFSKINLKGMICEKFLKSGAEIDEGQLPAGEDTAGPANPDR